MDIESKTLLSEQLRLMTAARPIAAVGDEDREERERMTLVTLQTLVERFEALEERVPTNEQLEFLTDRMEDQRWQLETWRRLTKWCTRLMAVVGAYGLLQSVGLKPLDLARHILGFRP